MNYSTLMVHLQLGRSNTGVLQIAADLAQRLKAGVIGIAACQPMVMFYGDGFVSGDVYDQDRKVLDTEIKQAEAEFRAALEYCDGPVEWRSAVVFALLSDYIAREARSADLVITEVASGDLFDSSRSVNTGDLVMQSGRPVLVVPAGVGGLKLDCVVVGWNDTRECRRAVCDALPLLRLAGQVVVAEINVEDQIAPARARVDGVVAWLGRHGVTAQGMASLSSGDDARALVAIAQEQGAGVIVAGAYGHSRLREWAFGGVTRNLLLGTSLCSLLSH